MAAYYNEFDAYAAEWLRNLIAAGHIAPGDVDERSIEDVRGDDLRGYTQVHLFAGIGGWSLALRLAGWPDSEPVWTGSCPCQPFSAAGKRGGADDPRHLWPHMLRLIGECRPPVVFGEQVASAAVVGKVRRDPAKETGAVWIDGVFDDLEAACYTCGAIDIPAAGVSAPHIRQRLWWVAERLADAKGQRNPHRCQRTRWRQPDNDGSDGGLVYPERDGRGPDQQGRGPDRGAATRGAGAGCGMGDAADNGRDGELQPESAQDQGRMCFAQGPDAHSHWGNTWLQCSDGTARRVEPSVPPLAYGLPRSVGDLRAGAPELGDGAGRTLKDARRFRKGALKGAGNSIVPQVAAEFIRAYMDAEKQEAAGQVPLFDA